MGTTFAGSGRRLLVLGLVSGCWVALGGWLCVLVGGSALRGRLRVWLWAGGPTRVGGWLGLLRRVALMGGGFVARMGVPPLLVMAALVHGSARDFSCDFLSFRGVPPGNSARDFFLNFLWFSGVGGSGGMGLLATGWVRGWLEGGSGRVALVWLVGVRLWQCGGGGGFVRCGVGGLLWGGWGWVCLGVKWLWAGGWLWVGSALAALGRIGIVALMHTGLRRLLAYFGSVSAVWHHHVACSELFFQTRWQKRSQNSFLGKLKPALKKDVWASKLEHFLRTTAET